MRSLVLFHEGEYQGAGVAVERILPGLRERGWEPHAWFPYRGPMLDAVTPLVESVDFRQGSFAFSVGGWRRDPGVLRRSANLPGYFRALRAALLRRRPDVVHANSLLTLPEATLARRMGIPVVLHMHELPEPGPKTDLTLRWAAAAADVVVTVSDAVQQLLDAHAGRTASLRVYNGLAPAAFDAPRRQEPRSRMLVGTVGGMTSRKGVDVFLEAARLVTQTSSDVDVLHVGPPPWESDAYIRQVGDAIAAVSPERLTVAGTQPAAAALRTMDVFVMASRQDPFPLAVLEAMAAGLAVIVTDVGGLPEQVEHLVSGIVVAPDDPGAIVEWILRLAAEPELRMRLAAAARRRVEDRFSLDRQVQGLDEAYRRAIDIRRGGRGAPG